MKAAVVTGYGGPEAIRLVSPPDPLPGAGELLVRVHAASLNPLDLKLRSGALRRAMPLRFPAILGFDFAGVVEGVGLGTAGWSTGDPVYGRVDARRGGMHAERAVVPASVVDRIPNGLSFEGAASLPLAALTALQAIDLIGPRAGDRILVCGVAGGVGSVAAQLGRTSGADVIGAFRGRPAELGLRLGIRGVGLVEGDALRGEGPFDGVVDTVFGAPTALVRSLLASEGRYVTTGFAPGLLLQQCRRLWSRQRFRFVRSSPSGSLMRRLSALVASGQVRPVVDTVFDLADVQAAHARLDRGGVVGKVVLAMR
ncbi:MAG: NADP-dependent oxidoreductase [Gemmatimonadales bacterium]|nr:NADP-dependent oxidoreductase [Gemmatimonadales bacterium]